MVPSCVRAAPQPNLGIEQAGQEAEIEQQTEDGVDVAEDRRHVEGLGLELIDPLPLVHNPHCARRASPGRHRLPGAELAAGGGDVGAAVPPHGGGDAVGPQPLGKRLE